MQATKPGPRFEVTTNGVGVVGHAGAGLLVELADRLGLTSTLDWRAPQGRRRHPDAQVLRDLAVMLADGGDCLSDLAVMRDQPELFGRIASTPTAWPVIERDAKDPRRAGASACRPRTCPRSRVGGRRPPRCRAAGHRCRRDPGPGAQ